MRRWIVIALFVFSMVMPAFSQGLTAVNGVVTDPSGAVIPGVEVTVTNTATALTRSTLSNETGHYSITQLPPGTYTVRASLQGFKAKVVNNVPLPVNETITLNLPMEVGALTDVVDVLANAEVVNTTNAQLGVAFDQKKIIDLPLNARNIVGLLSLQAGVTISNKSGGGEFDRDDGGQVNGARNDQQNIVLDGVNINAQESGFALEGALPTTLDSVQEFIVQTAGQSGGAGRSSGAQVQLVTKSGSNDWHGSAYEYYRTTGTSARNYFSSTPTRLIRHLPGGSVGGAIKKDRMFLFGAYERQTDRSGTLESRTVPTPNFLNGIVRYRRRDGSFGVITDGPGGMLEKWTNIPGDRWNSNVIGANALFEKYRPFSTDTANTRPGPDQGANWLTYRFNAPFIRNRNVYISRIDYNINTRNNIYARGTLNDDVRTLAAETFPGFNNARNRLDNSKGFALNWNSVVSNNFNSNLSFGLTRESFQDTGAAASFWSPSRSSNLIQTTGAQGQSINTWNLVENLSWLKGNHTIEFGGNYRFIDNKLRSFSVVNLPRLSSPANLTGNLIGSATSPGLARALGAAEFATVADAGIVGDAVMEATGTTSLFSEGVQFTLNGVRLPVGSPFVRRFGMQEYDYYIQDTWRTKANLTLSYGLHYAVQTPPYERDGVQVNWMQHLGARYNEQRDTTKDISKFPLLTVQSAGRSNGLPDYYQMDTNNFAPRVSVAWSPSILSALTKKGGQMVIRGGYALTYDRIGGRFSRDAATSGSIGLVQSTATPGFTYSIDGLNNLPRAPRIGAGGALPIDFFPRNAQQDFSLPAATGGFGGLSSTGIDSGLHSPTNHLVNVTVSKELPGGWVVEGSYVGRYARDLLGQADIATNINLRDPRSGQTMYDAVNEMFTKYENNGTPIDQVQPIAWFENVYPEMKPYIEGVLRRTFSSATQAWYAYVNQSLVPGPNASLSIYDQWGSLENGLKKNKVTNPQVQFWGLFSNFSKSNYHSGQFSVRKRFGQGFTLGANYTLSKSMDITSAAEARGNRPNGTTGEGLVEDPYHPELSYDISDFDRRHQFNGNFLVELPFGRGKWLGKDVPGVVDQIIGGWQISGITVLTSGRPWNFTASSRFNWHWFGRDIPEMIKQVPFELTKSGGQVWITRGTSAERTGYAVNNFRNTHPGGPVARNQGIGPNFQNVDLAVTKSIRLHSENLRARFRVEAFNLFNHPNFNVPTTEPGHNIDRRGNLGEITTTQGTERVMQFSFRIEF